MSVLDDLYNSHAGRRCFIAGNGPSLNKMDLSLMKDDVIILQNRGHLLAARIGRPPNLLVAVDAIVVKQFHEEMKAVPCTKFSNENYLADWEQPGDDVIFLNTAGPIAVWQPDIRRPFDEGHTVTNVSLHIAFFMGFDPVYLIGVDHFYLCAAPPNARWTSEGHDVDHFDPNYLPVGMDSFGPDLERSERSYRMVEKGYREAGRQVLNAGVDSRLEIFPRVDYRSLFNAK